MDRDLSAAHGWQLVDEDRMFAACFVLSVACVCVCACVNSYNLPCVHIKD